MGNKPDLQNAYDDVFELFCILYENLYMNANTYGVRYDDIKSICYFHFLFPAKTMVEVALDSKFSKLVFGTISSQEIIRSDNQTLEDKTKKSFWNGLGGFGK